MLVHLEVVNKRRMILNVPEKIGIPSLDSFSGLRYI